MNGWIVVDYVTDAFATQHRSICRQTYKSIRHLDQRACYRQLKSGAQGRARIGTNQSCEIGNGSRTRETIGLDAIKFQTTRKGPREMSTKVESQDPASSEQAVNELSWSGNVSLAVELSTTAFSVLH